MHCIVTFTKSFAQILSRDFGFLQNCGQTERSSENHYPNPNIGLHPNPNPDPNPKLNPNPNPSRTKNETFVSLAGHVPISKNPTRWPDISVEIYKNWGNFGF